MKRRHILYLISLVVLALLMIGAIIYASLVLFNRSMYSSRNASMLSAGRFAAELVDGDSVNRWLSRGVDEEYEDTGDLLSKLLIDTENMTSVFVCRYTHDGYITVYDYSIEDGDGVSVITCEQPGTAGDIGEPLQYDIERLAAGEEISDSDTIINGNMYIFVPIYDSNGNYTAHVGVGYSLTDIITGVSSTVKKVIALATVFLLCCILIGLRVYNRVRSSDELEKKLLISQKEKHLFDETAIALANAIDAKDRYTHGHSMRVAEYSRKIARLAGKTEEECEEIYYAGLLHDVGKIGVPEAIITKEGRLTNEEYNAIKQHSLIGSEILKDITEYPYLSIGAKHHHERFDGKGYPGKLVGTDIPDIARIIAVADAYDAMTSGRSYRKTIPQQKVREEFVACSGSQFDPQYANIMLHLIDMDTDYQMKEQAAKGPNLKDELISGNHRECVSRGIDVIPQPVTVTLKTSPDVKGNTAKPSMILYDSLDGRYCDTEKEISNLHYYEFCELYFDGGYEIKGARKIDAKVMAPNETTVGPGQYRIEACKLEDHILIRIIGNEKICRFIIALPDCSRSSYIGFTGEHCIISDMALDRAKDPVSSDFIPRIADKISYIDVPEGDIPNIQVDRYRSASSKGIKIEDGMTLSFHTMSLPTARLVWHCPFCVLFSSDDGTVNGENYVEYALIRLDGETWRSLEAADNELIVTRQHFEGWDNWKKLNREGYDVKLSFVLRENKVITRTENAGIFIKNSTTVKDKNAVVYAALTGDQCAITYIRIGHTN